jgi:hypothetical protein
MGAHSTTQSNFGQERGGSYGAIRRLEPKKCQENTILDTFCYGLFHPEIGTFRNPLQIYPFMLPIELGLRFAVLGIREGAIPTMKVICSWCRQEGKLELVGEKAPLDDARETHGICVRHRHNVQARWQAWSNSPAHSDDAA